VAGCWLAGWMSHAGIVLKQLNLSKSFSTIILVSSDPCNDTQFQGNPFSGGVKYTSGWKNWRFSTEIAVYLGYGEK